MKPAPARSLPRASRIRPEERPAGRGRAPGAAPLRWIAWAFLLSGCSSEDPPIPRCPGLRATAPALILHDWFGGSPVATPTYVRDNLAFLESQPFDGIAVYARTPSLSLNVTSSVLSGTPMSYPAISSVLAPLKGIPFRNLTENFVAVVGGRPPDFFEDWSAPVGNFANLARAAREAGLRGIYMDNENYDAPWARYPEGLPHHGRSLARYQEQARLRGRQLMEAMVSQYRDITVILLHGPYISEPRAPSPLFPRWQSANELQGPFFAGLVEGAGEHANVVDGGELYHLRTEEEFRRSRHWRKNVLPSDEMDCPYIPRAIRPLWGARVGVGFGVIDQPFRRNPMDPEILATTLARALREADRYAWLYVEGPSFLKPPERGGAARAWVDAVRRGRAEAAGKPGAGLSPGTPRTASPRRTRSRSPSGFRYDAPSSMSDSPAGLTPVLPATAERALLERFLRAEAMAMWAVRSAQAHAPPGALAFLKRHEEEEQEHLRQFEKLTGIAARGKAVPPRVPKQWHALAVQLYGYEALGLEFARLLAGVRPDLAKILEDEEVHVGFFEKEVRAILDAGRGPANGAREFARAWIRRLPKTVDRYLRGDGLDPFRDSLREGILASIARRFTAIGLLDGARSKPGSSG